MKYLTGVILLLIHLGASAQNYSFLNSGTKKLFVSTVTPYNAYSISFDSVLSSGNDTAYYNFLLARTLANQVPSNCPFWGTGCLSMRDLPSWIGHPVEYVSTGAYRFYNVNGDTLNFDLNLNIGDTSVFYRDNLQIFKIVFETTDTVSVFGNTDSANFYRIVHTDTSGVVILSSALNQQQVIVAKDNGLIQFFKVDSFPQVLIPCVIAGNSIPQGGLTALTNEMIYDHQPGDEIQSMYYAYTPGGPPWLNITSYTKETFASRVDLPDSIIYLVYREFFNIDSISTINDTLEYKYYRYDTIASVPIEFYDENGSQRSLGLNDYCGQYLWTYQIYNPHDVYYCPDDNCYGGIDVFAYPYRHFSKYVAGLGAYQEEVTPIILASSYTYSNNEVIYFKKNGIPCGQQRFVGINEHELANENIMLFPNPAENLLHINLQNANGGKNYYQINNLLGTINAEGIIMDNETTLNISQLEKGIYFLRIFSNDKTVAHGKFIKAN